jgi:hypothetical protein
LHDDEPSFVKACRESLSGLIAKGMVKEYMPPGATEPVYLRKGSDGRWGEPITFNGFKQVIKRIVMRQAGLDPDGFAGVVVGSGGEREW